MFWNRPEPHLPEEPQELRSYLAARIRLALEFATLGAYELSEGEGSVPPRALAEDPYEGNRGASRTTHTGCEPARREHVGDSRVPCAGPALQASDCSWQRASGRRASDRWERRAGSLPKRRQPCTWHGD